jgi:protein DEK
VFVILVLVIGKRGGKGKDKNKEPSDEELKTAIIDILKGVDFNTATFTDILKRLDAKFNISLASKKSSIKRMIQDELTKLADEAEDEEGEEEDAEHEEEEEKEKAKGSGGGEEVKA